MEIPLGPKRATARTSAHGAEVRDAGAIGAISELFALGFPNLNRLPVFLSST
jgi:hypothetical protein